MGWGLLLATVVWAESPPPVLRGVMEAVRTDLLVGEPVTVRQIIYNDSGNSVVIYGEPQLSVVNSQGVTNRGPEFATSGNYFTKRIAPWGSTTNWISVASANKWGIKPLGALLVEPGNYQVLGRTTLWDKELWDEKTGYPRYALPSVMVSVREPVGEDALMWEQLRGLSMAGRLLLDKDAWYDHAKQEEELARIAELVRQYPGSVYAHYLALGLGRLHRYKEEAKTYFELAMTMTQVPHVRDLAFYQWEKEMIKRISNEDPATYEPLLRELPLWMARLPEHPLTKKYREGELEECRREQAAAREKYEAYQRWKRGDPEEEARQRLEEARQMAEEATAWAQLVVRTRAAAAGARDWVTRTNGAGRWWWWMGLVIVLGVGGGVGYWYWRRWR